MLSPTLKVLVAVICLAFLPLAEAISQTGHIEYSARPIISSGSVATTLDVSPQDLTPTDLEFSNDGSKLFFTGNGSDNIYQYNLSVAYDITTAVLAQTLNVGDKDTAPTGIAFSSSGFQMFMLGNTTDSVYQYNLSIPFEISTANIFDGASLFVRNEDSNPTAVEISPDGTKVYVLGSATDNIYEYILSNANTVATGAYSGNSHSVGPTLSSPEGMRFNANGTKLYVTGTTTDRVWEYALSTPYDINTALDNFVTFDVSNEEVTPFGIALDSTGTSLFVIGASSRSVIRYNLTNNAFYESSSNSGELVGEMIISITGDQFVNQGNFLTPGTHYNVDNLPSGLTPSVFVAADGASAVLTLSGSALGHDNINDIDDIQMTFTNAAVSGGNIAVIDNAVSGTSGLRIDFSPDLPKVISYSANPLISTAVFNSATDISLTEGNIRDFFMTPDGFRFFLTGTTGRSLIQMNLSVAYDMSTAVEAAELDLTLDFPNINSFTFSNDGMRAYVIDLTTDAMQEIVFEQPYDITTAYLIGKLFFFSSEDSNPESILWSDDGTKLFMLGNSTDRVYEYNAATPFDISSLVYSNNSYSVSGQTIAPTDMAFNSDGSEMYVLGINSDRIFGYNLDVPYDITTASYTTVNISISTDEPNAQGLQLINNGSQLLLAGVTNDDVITYDFTTTGFYETGANQGAVDGEIILNLTGDMFSNAGGALLEGSDYSITNLPAGLTSTVFVAANGRSAYVSVEGVADAHDDTDAISNLQFNFNNSAFVDGDASAIANASIANSGFPLLFNKNLITTAITSPEILITSANLAETFDVSTVESNPRALTFSRDGLKMFFAGSTSDKVYEYSLSTPYEITSALLLNQLDLSFDENNVSSLEFNPTGSRMYVLGKTKDAILEYFLQTPYDLSTASLLGEVLSVGSEEANPEAMHFNEEGTRLFVVGTTSDAVYQYNLEEPFDFGSATYSGFSYAVNSETISPSGLHFSIDGTRMFTSGNSSDRIFTYDLSTPFDITTASSSGVSFKFSDFDLIPEAIHIDPKGTKLLAIGVANTNVYAFDLTNDAFSETPANDGTIEGVLKITLQEAEFSSPGSDLTVGVDYTIPALPAGLVPQITQAADGRSAYLTLSGSLPDHDDANDISGLSISWLSSAFTDPAAAAAINTTGEAFGIDFDADLPPALIYSQPSNLAAFDNVSNLNLTAVESNLTGITFSSDGTKFYVIGTTNKTIFEYTMSAPYDIQSAAQTAQFNLTFEETAPTDVTINNTGTRLFIVGSNRDMVQEILLEVPYDLSTAAFTGKTLDISTEELTPTGIRFSASGDRLFVVGSTSDNVYQYDLSENFNISTATYLGKSKNINSQAIGPTSLGFDRTGTRMYVSGSSSDRIFLYDLATPFEVNTATFANVSLLLSSADNIPEGFFFDPSGTRFFLVGGQNDNLYEFSTDNFAFQEESTNDGAVDGSLIVTPTGDNFSLVSGTLTFGTDYLINNLPAGLTASLETFDNGSYAALTLTGTATSNDNSDDISSLNFTFLDGAFSSLTAADFSNAASGESNLGINFTADPASEISYSLPGLITTARLNNSFAVNGEDLSPTGLTFNNDGTKMYVLGITNDNIYEYQLSTAYDISSASLLAQLGVQFEETSGSDITFNSDGTKLFMVGQASDDVIEYRLREPFDISTAFITGSRLNVNAQDATPADVAFSNDGLRMFVIGSTTDAIYQYNLPAPFELEGGTYTGVSQTISTSTIAPTAMQFNYNGTKLLITGSSSDRLHAYSMSTPFDLATLTDDNVSINLTSIDNSPSGLFLDRSGTRLYMLGQQNDQVYAFGLTTSAFREKGANDGSVEGELQINVSGDTFTNTSGFLTDGTDFTVDNLPAGLVPSLQVSADGTFATLSLSGNAASHDNADDLSDISVTFSNSAFAGNDAVIIGNAIGGSSDLGLNFTVNDKFLTYAISPDFSTAVKTNRFYVGGEELSPSGLSFNNDGSKMYIIGFSSDQIYEYTLSVNYDITTAVLSGSLSTVLQETSVNDIAFSTSGNRLYMMGQNTRNVYEYLLEEPFDLNTAAYTGISFDISSEESAPSAITFRPDGLAMYMVGTTTDVIYQYDLGTAYDISSASFSGTTKIINTEFVVANAISFNTNGTVMYVSRSNTRQLGQYDLSVPYDIATATFAGNMLDFLNEDNSPADFVFEPSAMKLFMLGAAEDSVWTYEFSDLAFTENIDNSGSVDGEILIGITGGAFTNAGGQLTDVSVDNIPTGLVPQVNVAGDGLSAVLQLTGNATEQAAANSVNDLILSFGNAAFADGAAATYANAISAPTGFQLQLFGPLPPSDLFILEVSDSQLDLSWTDVAADEEEYVIYRSIGDTTNFSEVATVAADITTYSDLSVVAGNTYFYYVTARNTEGESSPSGIKAGATFLPPGNALAFDGIDDFVAVSDLNVPSGDFTLEAWIRYEGTGVGNETVIEFGDDSPWFGISNGTLTLFGYVIDSKPFIRNIWTHIAVSYNSVTQDMNLLVNGEPVANITVATAFGGASMGIGHNQGDNFFPGLIDEVRIWEVERTQAEIQSALETELVGNEAGLLAYYKFDQTVSGFTMLPDRSTNNFNGVLTGFDFGGFGTGSDWNNSEALTVTIPGPPVALAATAVTDLQFTANWEPEAGVTDYVFDLSTDVDFIDLVPGFDNISLGDVSELIVNGLTYDTEYFYRLRGVIVPGDTTDYSNVIAITTDISTGTIADSTALSRIYNELGGTDWFNNDNWVTPGTRIEDWVGVTVENNRVTAIDLESNNLTGSLSEFTGEELSQLTSLILANNQLSGLPDLSGISGLTVLRVEGNFLAFDDLEPNAAITGISYVPQNILLSEVRTVFNEGVNITIDRVIGGSGNVYTWTKDGIPITGGADGTFEVGNVTFSDEGVYVASVTNPLVPGLTINTASFDLVVSSLEKDITALTAIYEATGGPEWQGINGWLDDDINNWDGVGLTGNRVTSITLVNANLVGTLPDAILDILNLESVVISGNSLDSIPSLLSLENLTVLDVINNELQFDDLQANIGIETFRYADQRFPGGKDEIRELRGGQVMLSKEVKGAGNVYQWTLNGQAITGANSDMLIIDDLGFEDMGNYSLIITNPALADLELESPADSVVAITTVTGTVTGRNSTLENGEVVLLRIIDNNQPYIPVDSIGFTGGVYTFPDVTLSDYIVSVIPTNEAYIPTYHQSGLLWNETDTLFLRENEQTADVELISDPAATAGTAAIAGIFEEEFTEEGREEARRRVRRVGVALRRRRSSGRTNEDEFELVAYTQTDDEGRFSFPNLPAGVYRINFEFPGVPMDENSFVEFEIVEGEEPSNLVLEAVATDDGKIVVTDVTEDPVSVDELILPFDVFPNPAKSSVTIDFRKIQSKSLQVIVLDNSGRQINKIIPKNGYTSETIDLTDYDQGMYLIRLIDQIDGHHYGTYRLIKN